MKKLKKSEKNSERVSENIETTNNWKSLNVCIISLCLTSNQLKNHN